MIFDFPTTPQACLIYGGPRTGKTQQLIDRVARLLEEGAYADDIVIFAASPDAADELRARLSQTSVALTMVRVSTPRELALKVLATSEACADTGRNPRVLNQYETNFLLEDMKGTGIRPKRLKGMLGFFYRSWTELTDLDPEWLELKEEEEAYTLLTELLNSNKAYLEPQLSNVAWRVLNTHPNTQQAFSVAHVLVDDYPCLSLASQMLVNLIARESICLAGDPNQCVEVFESYPHAAGMDEFAAAMPEAERIELTDSHLGQSRLNAILSLYASGKIALEHDKATTRPPRRAVVDPAGVAPTTSTDELLLKACLNPEEESSWLVSWVQEQLDKGISPAEVAIVVPSASWERRMAQALRQAELPIRVQSATRPVSGDIRSQEASRAAQVLCLLTLAAHPDDEPSLRAWCGFGEYLTNSQIFAEFRRLMTGTSISLQDLLAAVTARKGLIDAQQGTHAEQIELPSFQFKSEEESVASAYASLSCYLEQLQGLTGKQLVHRALELIYGTARAPIPPNLAYLLGFCTDDMDARSFVAAIRQIALYPRMPQSEGVRIMRQEATRGLSAQAVAVVGLVNGFTPSHQSFDTVATAPDRAEIMRSKASRGMINALGMAQKSTALSWFTELPYREATRLDLKVERIYIKDGLRRARVERTILLKDFLER